MKDVLSGMGNGFNKRGIGVIEVGPIPGDIIALYLFLKHRNRNFIPVLKDKLLLDRLLSQGYEVKRLRNSFKKFYGRYPDLIGKYQRSVKDMIADSFPD